MPEINPLHRPTNLTIKVNDELNYYNNNLPAFVNFFLKRHCLIWLDCKLLDVFVHMVIFLIWVKPKNGD